MKATDSIPPGFKLRYTFRGHDGMIYQIAWSPDGKMLASSSDDDTIQVWNIDTGKLYSKIETDLAYSVSWSSDGKTLAKGSTKGIMLWDVEVRQLREELPFAHHATVYSVAWSPDGKTIATYWGKDIQLWDVETRQLLQKFVGHTSRIRCVVWSPDGKMLASGSHDMTIRLWDVETGRQLLRNFTGHRNIIRSIAWSPDGKMLASGSEDSSICLWDVETGGQKHVLESHTSKVFSVSFSFDGRLLASKSRDGSTRIWRCDTWEPIAILDKYASFQHGTCLAFHPKAPILATLGEQDTVIYIWDLDLATLLSITPITSLVHYTNAKVVLVGESGVGKSGLALVLTGHPYAPTDSTHGRYIWNFDKHEKLLDGGRTETHETMLWDLAGQPSYRLIHQLHLSEVALALVIIDAHSTIDPFVGIPHWVRALRMAQQAHGNTGFPLKKLLVTARIDRGGVKVSRERIDALVKKWGFDGYFETSAQAGLNITMLADAIKQAVEWDKLPKVTSTDLFQRIKAFLVSQKETGKLLPSSDDLYRDFLHSQGTTTGGKDLRAEFETCISLVESQGLIRQLTFGNLILLQPELLDAYASALINAARAEPDELGSISEEQVKNGNFLVPEGEGISNREQERLLLIAMIEDLLRHEIALREQGLDGTYLVFPSEAVRENPDLPDPEGKSVIFDFEGPVQNIYTTLAVRLSHSGTFKKKEMWKDAVTYEARVGGTCGIFLQEIEEGRGKLSLFFDKAASEETRFQFEEYVKIHLERRTLPEAIQRRRIFVCPECKLPLDDERVRLRREKGYDWMLCGLCDVRVSLLDSEERLAAARTTLVVSEIERTERTSEMDRAADSGVKREADFLTVQGKQATSDFDVFLCHHNVDKPAVKKIGEQMKEQGILPWLDEWELQPGLPWQRLLEEQIAKIKSAAVFIGKDGIGPWEKMELEAFLHEFVRRGCPVIPVILADAPKEPKLPIFLGGMTWVDFRKQEPVPMEQLIWGITGVKSQVQQYRTAN